MNRAAHVLRQPVVIIWSLLLLTILADFRLLTLSPISWSMMPVTAVFALLFMSGDLVAVPLEDGSLLTPTPVLLLAGLAIVAWPLLGLALLLGSLGAALLHRRFSIAQAFMVAGGRGVLLGLLVPIAHFTQVAVRGYTTPVALAGLLAMGTVVYLLLLFARSGEQRHTWWAHWRARFVVLRWYPLAQILFGGLLGVLWYVSPWAFGLGLAPLLLLQHTVESDLQLRRTKADFAHEVLQREALASRFERLQALATTMIGTLDIQTMLEILCERLAALLEAPAGWVVLLDENNQPCLMTCHNLTPIAAPPIVLTDPQAYASLFERGRVMLFTDERCQTLAPIAASDLPPWSAVLCIPLLAEKKVLGAICLAFNRLRGLDVDEQRVLTSFARQAAVVIENARLFDELKYKQHELIQSSKLAAVGTFAAGIAHEFNNLLGSMLGYAELGYGINNMDEKNRSLEVVIQACRRGRSITRGLLTFARRQEHQRALADISDAIHETLALVEIELQKLHITVVQAIEPVPPTVCDVGQLAQVVLNLITNARDAMKPRGGTLTIGLHLRRDWIELSVADTGSGIPTEIRDKIFEPFVTTKGALGGSQTPGTGLGLSVSYGIVQEHGGSIEVDSVLGRGTTMTVRLPVVGMELEREIVVGLPSAI